MLPESNGNPMPPPRLIKRLKNVRKPPVEQDDEEQKEEITRTDSVSSDAPTEVLEESDMMEEICRSQKRPCHGSRKI